jgi:PadR family transcriptional regulator, regulatory protein AphA
MSLPYALLGLVNYKPATGYELKTIFTRSINMFWNASLPQIYRTLNQMESKGWLSSSVEHQEGKPSRKIYRITVEGRQELDEWLVKPIEFKEVKSEMMLKVFFGNVMDQKDFVNHIRARRESARRFLEKTPKEVGTTINEYASKTGAEGDTLFWLLTYDFGRRRAQATVEWCDAALDLVEKRGKAS